MGGGQFDCVHPPARAMRHSPMVGGPLARVEGCTKARQSPPGVCLLYCVQAKADRRGIPQFLITIINFTPRSTRFYMPSPFSLHILRFLPPIHFSPTVYRVFTDPATPPRVAEEVVGPDLLAKKSGNIFRVGIFLDFVWLTTRTPHGAYVRRARRNRIDRHGGEIERLATRTTWVTPPGKMLPAPAKAPVGTASRSGCGGASCQGSPRTIFIEWRPLRFRVRLCHHGGPACAPSACGPLSTVD